MSSQRVDAIGGSDSPDTLGSILAVATALPPGQAESVLAALFASLPLGAAVIGADGAVLVSVGEPIQLLNDVAAGELPTTGHLQTLLAAARQVGRAHAEGVYDGNVLSLTATAFADGRIVLIAHDVTEQRRAAAELVQARTVAELASQVEGTLIPGACLLNAPLPAI